MPYSTKQIRLAYKSEYNNKRENQVILLMITDGQKWHYLSLKSEPIFYDEKLCNRPVKRLPRLHREITSNHHGDFYCLNCFHSCSTENRLKEHENICNKHDNCRIEMPKRFQKILKHNHGKMSLKAPFAIYPDLECLLLKTHLRQNNPEKSYTEKKAKHEPSGWAMFAKCKCDATENKLDYYRGIDHIKTLCKKLKDHALKILTSKINFEEKELIPLTDEENKSYEEQEVCHLYIKKVLFR